MSNKIIINNYIYKKKKKKKNNGSKLKQDGNYVDWEFIIVFILYICIWFFG